MLNYKEIIFYGFKLNNNFFFIVLSNLFGWTIIKINSRYMLFNLNLKLNFYKIFGVFFLRSFLGFYRLFLQCLILKGMGYKSLILKPFLFLKLSQSHRLVYKVKKNIKISYLNKQLLFIRSKFLTILKNLIYFLQKYSKVNIYKKKGFFLKGSIIFTKVSSKKSKF